MSVDELVRLLNLEDSAGWAGALARLEAHCVGDARAIMRPRAFAELLPRLTHKRHARRLMTVYRDALVEELVTGGRPERTARKTWDAGQVHFLKAWAAGRAIRQVLDDVSHWETVLEIR